MHSFFNLARLACLSMLCALLASCGGGDEKAILYGTASIGMPLANATVTVADANGHSATAITASNGNFALEVTGFSGPLLLTTTDPSGLSDDLVSILAAAPAAGGKATANLTPLTTALAAMLTVDGKPYAITPAQLSALVGSLDTRLSVLKAILANLLTNNSVTSSSFNPVTSTYSANNTGIDAVNSQVHLLRQVDDSVHLKESASTGYEVTLNTATDATTVFSTPAFAASYLDWLATELKNCLAAAVADRAANLTCTGIVDSANSYTYANLQTANANFALATSVGATVGVPQTTAFYTDVSSNQLATVRFPYTLTDGTTGIANLTVRKIDTLTETATTLPDGVSASWVIFSSP